MDHLKVPVNIMKDKRGSAVMLLGLLFIFGFFLFSLIVLDYIVMKTNMEKSKDAVTAACLAGLGELNQEALSYNIIEIDLVAAEATFRSYLEDNLQGISSTVVEEFQVYNRDDLPVICTNGNTLTNSSIHTVVPITLNRTVLRGLLGDNYSFRIHVDCDNTLE